MKNDLERQEIIELSFIAKALNEMIGPAYRVVVNSKTKISKDSVTDVNFQARRIPFAITGIASETLEVILEVYAQGNNDEMRNKTLKELNVLIGHRNGVINTADNDYTFASFLEFDRPLGQPYCDSGNWYSLYCITGTMLISDSQYGAVVSNENFTRIYLGDPTDAKTLRGMLPILAINTEVNYNTENIPISNSSHSFPLHSIGNCVVDFSALVLRRALDKAIVRIIQTITESLDIYVYLERTIMGEVSLKKCKILGGKILEPAGAYSQYSFSLCEVN